MTDDRVATSDSEMDLASDLPQLDATSLVEASELESKVKEMYRQVADEEDAERQGTRLVVARWECRRAPAPRRTSRAADASLQERRRPGERT